MSVALSAERDVMVLELTTLVDVLTVPGKHRLDTGECAAVMCTLDALEDAQTARDGLAGSAPASHRAPVRVGVLELLAHIDATVGTGRRRATRAGSVRAWLAVVVTGGGLDAVSAAVDHARYWTDTARALLEPRRTLRLRGCACPACGAEHVIEQGSGGEELPRPVLIADLCTGAVFCLAEGCGVSWPLEALHLLAEQLDVQNREILAVDE